LPDPAFLFSLRGITAASARTNRDHRRKVGDDGVIGAGRRDRFRFCRTGRCFSAAAKRAPRAFEPGTVTSRHDRLDLLPLPGDLGRHRLARDPDVSSSSRLRR